MTPPNKRQEVLTRIRNVKMARSPHAFVRGNTIQFYKWLSDRPRGALPEGPPIWICGDCHVGNLGPIANADGHIRVQIRDLDQTVIGNPAHDLIRLGLSLASAARGSDLPGVTTARMIESLIEGYEQAFDPGWDGEDAQEAPPSVRRVVREANRRTWKQLAKERIRDTSPDIPLGKKFWPLEAAERAAIVDLFDAPELRELATSLHSRELGRHGQSRRCGFLDERVQFARPDALRGAPEPAQQGLRPGILSHGRQGSGQSRRAP